MKESISDAHPDLGQTRSRGWLARLIIPESPVRLVGMVALSAFLAEVVAMLILLLSFPSLSRVQRVVADGLLVVAFLIPTLYLFLLRPLTAQIARRRQAEEALRRSESRLRTVADFAYDWEYWINSEGEYVYNSPSCERITGYVPEDFQQDPRLLQKMTHPDDRALVEDHFEEERKDGIAHSLDFRIITRGGDERWVNHVCRQVHDERGRWLGWRGSNRDITARKRAERARERLLQQAERDRERIQGLVQALRRERDRLHTVMETTHAQLAYLDADFNFVLANTAYAEGSGYSQDELVGKNHFDLFPHAENEAIFERVRDTGDPVAFQAKPFTFPDRPELGTTYWDWTLVPVKDQDGEVEGLVFSLLDVTQRERLMRALQDERAKLQAIIDNAPEGLIVVDERARITVTNPAAAELFAEQVRHGEPIEGGGALSLCRPDGSPCDPRQLPLTRSALDGEAYNGVELDLCRSDGERRSLLIDTAPIRDHAGEITGAVGIFRDITRRKRTQEALQRYADRLRILHEVDRAILAARSAEEIAGSALPLLRELGSCQRASVEIYDHDRKKCRTLAVDGGDPNDGDQGHLQVLDSNHALETLRRGDLFIVDDLEVLDSSPFVDTLRADGARSCVSVPLLARDELIGCLNLARETPGTLTGEEAEIVWDVAAQLAIGLRQAQLYREVQAYAEELEARVASRTAQLRASEARFRAIFEQAALGIAILNQRGQLLGANPAFRDMLGETSETLAGRLFSEFTHPDEDTEELRETYRRILDGSRQHTRVETRYLDAHDRTRWANVVLSLVRRQPGEAEFVIALVEDITRRKEAQRELRRSQQRQALALEAVGGGIYEHPIPLDETAYHSDRWARILGYATSELPPASEFMEWLLDRVHPEDREALMEERADFIAGRTKTYHVELRLRHKSGRWVWVEDLAEATERDEEGRVTHVIGLMRDITERKQTEAALVQSERLATTGKLAASLAHEINNPLQAVIGCLGLAEESLAHGEEDDFEEYVTVGLEELRRASGVVSRLRDLSRPTDTEAARPSDVNALIDRVLSVSRKQLKSNQVRVVRRLADDLPRAELVADRVQQIFLNLVLNAAEAMPNGGELIITTRYDEDADEITAAFSDCGAGISEDMLPHIFDPFFSTKPEGTGLGLFVSQNIAQEHGGRIEVDNEPGEGCTFSVHLPVSQPQ